MKYYLLSLALFLPFLSAAAAVDCSSPRYNNPKLKQYCQSLEKSSQGSIRATEEKFTKDFSKYQLQLEAQVEGSDNQAGTNASGQQPSAPTQAPAQTPPAAAEPTPSPSQESVPTPTTTPTPSGKPRRYY